MQRNQWYSPKASSGIFRSRDGAGPRHFWRPKLQLTTVGNALTAAIVIETVKKWGRHNFLAWIWTNFVMRKLGQLKALQLCTRHFTFCWHTVRNQTAVKNLKQDNINYEKQSDENPSYPCSNVPSQCKRLEELN